MDQIPPADDISSMLAILPEDLRTKLEADSNGLIEVVMDLGRKPESRYFDKTRRAISDKLVTQADLDFAINKIGAFSGDNRAGIERTLDDITRPRRDIGARSAQTYSAPRPMDRTLTLHGEKRQ